MTQQQPDPPRRALRVLATHQEPPPDGAIIEADQWVILQPNETGYEAAYQQALAAWRTHGIPVPYATSDEPPPHIPAI